VSLDIYDLQGRLVRRLLDESPYMSGLHKQVWDGRDGDGRATSSGVYFYRFAAGDQKKVGKLTLLK
jgi:flagellar hook assembly protein FlgD